MILTSIYNKRFYNDQKSGSKSSAEEIVPLVLDLVRPQSVIDVGCGVGTWLSVFVERGITDYLGVDGEWLDKRLLQIPKSNFLCYDLTKPLLIDRNFDLAVSVEVAEHIPSKFAPLFVESLTNLSSVILFSAAIPRQGGARHVNEQWPSYWVDLFEKKDYTVVDALRRKIWKNKKVEYWYAQNILIFANLKTLKNFPSLNEEFLLRTFKDQLSIVHPDVYLAKARATELSIEHMKEILLSLPRRIRNARRA